MPSKSDQPRKKKQHFLPQLYLRGFASTDEKLSALDKTSGRSWPTSVRDSGHQNHFYRLPADVVEETSMDPQVIEDLLMQREGLYSRGLEQTLVSAACGTPASEQSRAALTLFLLDLLVRTPDYREYRKQSERALLEQLMELIAQKNRRNFEELGLADARMPKLVFNEEMGSLYNAEALVDEELRQMVFQSFMGMIWIVGENHTGIPFYTSDCPVARTAHDLDSENGGGWGYCSRGIELTFPLSRRYTLHLFDADFHERLRERHGSTMSMSRKEVEHCNRLQTLRSARFLYSPTDEWGVAKETMEQEPSCRDPERARLQSVRLSDLGDLGEDVVGQIAL